MIARCKSRLRFSVVVAAMTGLCATASLADTGQSFFDGFDTFDRERWRISDGWSNGSWQNCLWSNRNVDLVEGHLVLTFDIAADLSAEERPYRCGEIQSRRRFHYGTYEARLRTGTGSGINAAFFTYIGPIHDAPHDEIDFEILTRDTSRVSVNTYVAGEPLNGATAPVPGGTDADFHTYAFQWSGDGIRWYVDGTLIHEATENLPTEAQKIFFSLWGTDTLSSWMGPFDSDALPTKLQIDWVAFTEADRHCLFPDSVTCGLQ